MRPEEAGEALARRILDTDIRSAIEALRKAHREMIEEEGAELAAPLVDAAGLVVPALFDEGVVQHAKATHPVALVLLPAGTRTVAEIIMAAVDGREARFRPRENELDQPAGELCLPLHPEGGIRGDPSTSQALHIARKLDPGAEAMRGLRSAIDDYLLRMFNRSEPGAPERKREERILLASDLLEKLQRRTGQTYYMVFFLPEDAKERQPLEALVKELKGDYKAIAFLGLDPAFNQERADRALVDDFCSMLPLKAPLPPKPGTQQP